MNADDYARMTDEERAAFLRRRHVVAVVGTALVGVTMVLLMILLNDYYAGTPMCGTGQDHGPC
ncbi:MULTISPECIES: hypothetical protein [Streptomyces]|uniref:Integral membrane protein n=1 Tax=Streptomyces griseiscabiei TaxID=2993540 RepID=A0ABU4L745_9ACTN|nr:MULTISPECIES: hypothetical protein [Streptomyces]MBZ3907094.1 hypothetical protein [Streptomyces griseiscabiei]MDX2911522.1 hypothetical protein [Streptomyces griseiscabiei]